MIVRISEIPTPEFLHRHIHCVTLRYSIAITYLSVDAPVVLSMHAIALFSLPRIENGSNVFILSRNQEIMMM